MLMYGTYLAYMLTTMKPSEMKPSELSSDDEQSDDEDEEEDESPRGAIATLFYWISGGPLLDLERWFVKDHHREQMKEETWNG